MSIPAYHESLPYIDEAPTEEALAAARALISAEATASSPQPPAEAQQEPSFSPAIQTELQRVASQAPLATFDSGRYEAQEIPAPGTDADVSDLRQPLERTYVSSSYLGSRNQNLALLDRAGKNAWLLSNYHIEAELRAVESELAATKREIDILNSARATRQNDVKAEIQGLEETWRNGVGRVLETEVAVEELRAKIRQELKAKSAAEQQ